MVSIPGQYMLGWLKFLENICLDGSNTWKIYIRMVQIHRQYKLGWFNYWTVYVRMVQIPGQYILGWLK